MPVADSVHFGQSQVL